MEVVGLWVYEKLASLHVAFSRIPLYMLAVIWALANHYLQKVRGPKKNLSVQPTKIEKSVLIYSKSLKLPL